MTGAPRAATGIRGDGGARASLAPMLTIDEMLAPAAEEAPTRPYTFERLRGRPRLDLLPMSMRNPRWFDASLAASMRKDAEGGEAKPEDLNGLRAVLKEEATLIATTMVAGFAVQEEPDGPHVPRAYTPELGVSFFHRLIDLPQGLAEFVEFQRAIARYAQEDRAAHAIDPTATAGNSSGG